MIGKLAKRLRSASLVGALAALMLAPACAASTPTPPPEPTPTPTTVPTPTSTPADQPAGSAPAPPEPTATPTPAGPTFEEEWEALKAAARAEGKMTLVTGNGSSRGLAFPIREIFGKQFGIDVTIAGGSGSQHALRIAAERAAGRFEVDIVNLGRSTVGPRLGDAGFLKPLQEQLFHPDALDPSKWWMNRLWWREPDGVEPKYSIAISVTAWSNPVNPEYNTELVSEEDIAAVNTAFDFFDDKWKGKIIALSPLESGSSGGLTDIYSHPELGPEWIRRFYSKDMEVTFVGDVRQIVDSISLGGHAFTFFSQGAGTDLYKLASEGLPIGFWTKELVEGGRLSANAGWHWLGVMDRAPHPNAAQLFANWWLTKEGQTAYNLAGNLPPPSLREDVPPGNSDPAGRRIPGAVYEMSSLDVNLPDNRLEAIEFTQRIFLEGRE